MTDFLVLAEVEAEDILAEAEGWAAVLFMVHASTVLADDEDRAVVLILVGIV